MLTRPDPDALMAGPLGQWLAGQTQMREAARAKAAQIQMSAIGAACVVAFLIVIASPLGVERALQAGLFIGVAGFGWAEWSKRSAISMIKGGINEAIAHALDMQYSLVVHPGAEFDLVRTFGLVPAFERSNFEDLWVGEVGDHSFQVYESKLEVERSNGKSSYWETVFDGSISTIGFARRFNGVTLVERAGQRKRLFGLLGEKDAISLGGTQLGKVDMVDPRFGEEFAVWSNDQVEARYLVHPAYVEKLMAVESAFAGEKIRCLFNGGQLIVALESGNLFESGSLDASQDKARLEKTIDQFGTLVDLAQELNERAR
ncbi:MAG: DUF3137 domain-containing protein [Novosphingobium sp.]